MPTHAEKRILPYRPDQLYALVAGIEHYPKFLPWCVGARIRERTTNVVVADLIIGFKVFRERFTSRVTLDPEAKRIDVDDYIGRSGEEVRTDLLDFGLEPRVLTPQGTTPSDLRKCRVTAIAPTGDVAAGSQVKVTCAP